MAGPYQLNAEQSWHHTAKITICMIIIKCLCVIKIPVIFLFIPLLGMACIFYDDTFLHDIRDILC